MILRTIEGTIRTGDGDVEAAVSETGVLWLRPNGDAWEPAPAGFWTASFPPAMIEVSYREALSERELRECSCSDGYGARSPEGRAHLSRCPLSETSVRNEP